MLADRQSFSQLQLSSKNLQHNFILNMMSIMHGSLSQFSKFNPRNGSLPPMIWLILCELWVNQAWENYDFICIVAKLANHHTQTLISESWYIYIYIYYTNIYIYIYIYIYYKHIYIYIYIYIYISGIHV